MLQMKFDNDLPAGLRVIHFWKIGRTDAKTPARALYYKLTLSLRLYWAKNAALTLHIYFVEFALKWPLTFHNQTLRSYLGNKVNATCILNRSLIVSVNMVRRWQRKKCLSITLLFCTQLTFNLILRHILGIRPYWFYYTYRKIISMPMWYLHSITLIWCLVTALYLQLK